MPKISNLIEKLEEFQNDYGNLKLNNVDITLLKDGKKIIEAEYYDYSECGDCSTYLNSNAKSNFKNTKIPVSSMEDILNIITPVVFDQIHYFSILTKNDNIKKDYSLNFDEKCIEIKEDINDKFL